MRYIRTKDEIIDISNLKIDIKYNCYVDEQDIFQYPLNKYREADTIEELVDEFIIDFGKTNYPTTSRYKRYWDFDELKKEIEDRENNFHRYLNIDFIVYGAIWTDKGLIYVTKMNDEGELELC